MADGTSEEVKPKRVPRKRTAAKSAAMVDGNSRISRKRTTRSRATRNSKNEKSEAKVAVSAPLKIEKKVETKTERKAPTPLSAEKKAQRTAQIHTGITATIIFIGIITSAVIGYSDDGGIDVNAVIESRNEKIRESGSNETIIPVQNRNQEPDGGLIGLGVGTPKATSTPMETATSTEEVNEDETEDQEGQVPLSEGEAAAASENTAPENTTDASLSN